LQTKRTSMVAFLGPREPAPTSEGGLTDPPHFLSDAVASDLFANLPQGPCPRSVIPHAAGPPLRTVVPPRGSWTSRSRGERPRSRPGPTATTRRAARPNQ